MNLRKISAKHAADKGLVFKNNEILQVIHKKRNDQIKKIQMANKHMKRYST